MNRHIAYIGLGSNSGDRWANLAKALSLLKSAPDVELREISSVYESEPLELKEQPDFLNAACKVKTQLPPLQLLPLLQRIEVQLKRVRRIPKGPRTIDLDILLYDDLLVDEEMLRIPHPELHKRRFVLLPLVEISPGLIHPSMRKSFEQLLIELPDNHRVELIGRLDNSVAVRKD